MTHICVSKLTIIGSENGVVPTTPAIIWANAGILFIGRLRTNIKKIQSKFVHFHSIKPFWKWRPFCLRVNVFYHTKCHPCTGNISHFQLLSICSWINQICMKPPWNCGLIYLVPSSILSSNNWWVTNQWTFLSSRGNWQLIQIQIQNQVYCHNVYIVMHRNLHNRKYTVTQQTSCQSYMGIANTLWQREQEILPDLWAPNLKQICISYGAGCRVKICLFVMIINKYTG